MLKKTIEIEIQRWSESQNDLTEEHELNQKITMDNWTLQLLVVGYFILDSLEDSLYSFFPYVQSIMLTNKPNAKF